jgi:uncharacterized protein DUF998
MGDRGSARALLTGGVIGPVLFVVVLLIEGWTRAGYDPLTMYGSLLSLSDQGWQQVANFLVGGILILGGAIGLRMVLDDGPGSKWGPILIGLAGMGLILASVVVTDPCCSYPPGTPAGPATTYSWHGALHDLFSVFFVFGGPAAAMLVMARRFVGEGSRWALYSRLSAVGTVGFLIATFVSTDLLGLMQRLAILIALGWVAQIMWRYRREAAAAV